MMNTADELRPAASERKLDCLDEKIETVLSRR